MDHFDQDQSVLSTLTDPSDIPPPCQWWFHCSPLDLNDPLAPYPTSQPPSLKDIPHAQIKWTPFAPRDNEDLEQGWRRWTEEGRGRDGKKMREIKKVEEEKRKLKAKQRLIITKTPKRERVNPFGRFEPASPPETAEDVMAEEEAAVLEKPEEEDTPNLTNEGQTGTESALEEVVVGISRLHKVHLPTMTLEPIYWSPLATLTDHSQVIRATWFYAETNFPIEPVLEEALEAGYRFIRPYTDVYALELSAAKEVGQEAEHKLGYELDSTSHPSSTDPSAVEELQVDPLLKNRYVIYTDEREAWIMLHQGKLSLAKSLLGSLGRGRGPVGVGIVRGYDYTSPTKAGKSSKQSQSRARARTRSLSVASARTNGTRRPSMSPSEMSVESKLKPSATELIDEDPTPAPVTDLILVVHGIGQKLSERVESFTFTHAINHFRILLEEERLGAASAHVREGYHPQVLPVNWRQKLVFDAERGEEDETEAVGGTEEFGGKYNLNDITPEGIPAVRGLIADVMLDIPYYLSHHKDRITRAVVGEANRVWRLWIRNDPGFVERGGRVHIVGHSLGSAISMDILSRQPTKTDVWTPDRQDQGKESTDQFEFETHNLFFCGSPVGFFMLLNQANLIPRANPNTPKTANLPRSESHDGPGKYGCPAVQNVYNIYHSADPVAMRLAPTVDKEYAETLKPTVVPGVGGTQVMESLAHGIKNASVAITGAGGEDPRPGGGRRLPSTIELEVHDFSREAKAERRLRALNDNGQVDFVLPNTGGVLDSQYYQMIYAHSCYWEQKDFARLICVECGREDGPDNTLLQMRGSRKIEH
ncbi:hypothetical protein G7K_6765-t1 [Saitoella complicata NRRL Y-17804]|uniref:DDHD domain-containing protein n=1 Tax=Saitoella complicata (strain BCRC 22490 / CBS 7301 / JCM 7358 / NBRC 10748 / NRRL Y-17804) TaxID=698492 RepID=A0A0E9NS63_SAICN|nr:hypothetical protein G7K_6765-t1 [Saitoella complicata NRRL Y-17804]